MLKQENNIQSTSIKWITFILVGVLFACTNSKTEIAKFEQSEIVPAQAAKDVEILYSTKGNIVFQLNAPLLNAYPGDKEYKEMPEGVIVQIFDSAKNVTTRLTSNYAIDSTYVEKMEARYDVVVINDKGETLNTEHLVWDKKSRMITSDVFVKITTENQILMGDGLIANQDFSTYRILKPIGEFYIDND